MKTVKVYKCVRSLRSIFVRFCWSDIGRRGQMVMRNTQLETMEEGCCCQAGDFQEEIGRPGAVDPVHGLEVEEEGCHRAVDHLPPHHPPASYHLCHHIL